MEEEFDRFLGDSMKFSRRSVAHNTLCPMDRCDANPRCS
jgi:hypothetical protein